SGARHPFSPVGGAAKGIPLKTRTVGCPVLRVPAIRPVSIFTCSGIIADAFVMAATSDAAARKLSIRFMCSPILSVGPTVQFSAVHCFAASLHLAGSVTQGGLPDYMRSESRCCKLRRQLFRFHNFCGGARNDCANPGMCG